MKFPNIEGTEDSLLIKWVEKNLANVQEEHINDWLYVAEKLSQMALNSKTSYAQLIGASIAIYEKLGAFSISHKLTGVYLRINSIANLEPKDAQFWMEELRNIIENQFKTLEWQEIKFGNAYTERSLEEIRKLRTLKNWLQVLFHYESTQGIKLEGYEQLRSEFKRLP